MARWLAPIVLAVAAPEVSLIRQLDQTRPDGPGRYSGSGTHPGRFLAALLHRPVARYNCLMSRTLDKPVLERMLAPITRSLNVDAAKKLVRLKADAKVQARVAKLARKCNEGALTPEELAEYDRYIAFADIVAILQAKARLLLAKNS
jgi:hypothetical protein